MGEKSLKPALPSPSVSSGEGGRRSRSFFLAGVTRSPVPSMSSASASASASASPPPRFRRLSDPATPRWTLKAGAMWRGRGGGGGGGGGGEAAGATMSDTPTSSSWEPDGGQAATMVLAAAAAATDEEEEEGASAGEERSGSEEPRDKAGAAVTATSGRGCEAGTRSECCSCCDCGG